MSEKRKTLYDFFQKKKPKISDSDNVIVGNTTGK